MKLKKQKNMENYSIDEKLALIGVLTNILENGIIITDDTPKVIDVRNEAAHKLLKILESL